MDAPGVAFPSDCPAISANIGMPKNFVLVEEEGGETRKKNMQMLLKFRQICQLTQLNSRCSLTSVRVLWAYFQRQKRRGEDLCCVQVQLVHSAAKHQRQAVFFFSPLPENIVLSTNVVELK